MNYRNMLENLHYVAQEHVASASLGFDKGSDLSLRVVPVQSAADRVIVELFQSELSVAQVDVGARVMNAGGLHILFVTQVTTTICGHWDDVRRRARAMSTLYDLADKFSELTDGKRFTAE